MTEIVSRRERKKEETRHRIFHAAIDLFRERGFENTTVDEITEKADVAKGTFFNYFHRKEAVLAYLSETRLQAIEENAAAMLADPRPAPEKLFAFYSTAASGYEESYDLARFVLIELMRRAFTPEENLGPRWHAIVNGLVEQGQENGTLRRDVDVRRVEALLTSIYYATLYEWACCLEKGCPHGSTERFALQPELRMRFDLAMEGVAP
jgi:AcrR family transcriptional regulator